MKHRILVILGLALAIGGYIYPLQKKIELENKKVNFLEQSKIDSLELTYIVKDVNEIEAFISTHQKESKELREIQETLAPTSPKFQEIEKTIGEFKHNDLILIEKQRDKVFELEKKEIKLESLSQSIENTNKFISRYFWFQWGAILIGLLLLYFGLQRWNKSEKQSISIVDTEIEIKKQELEKLIRENTP